ncbi:DUF3278 domain-containing protein [Apilactobacillus micheneri]|nr:DUF3278 domain-containing protein [Apilactobacillus micheneri]TPR47060.1 DUF3278 domain-containing protein [Apilactobacillus micheneri]
MNCFGRKTMNNRESFFTKCIKRFYGITGPLDEYKRQEINRIGNNAFIVCWIYIMLSNFMFFSLVITIQNIL